jgi:hypothetical protein
MTALDEREIAGMGIALRLPAGVGLNGSIREAREEKAP